MVPKTARLFATPALETGWRIEASPNGLDCMTLDDMRMFACFPLS